MARKQYVKLTFDHLVIKWNRFIILSSSLSVWNFVISVWILELWPKTCFVRSCDQFIFQFNWMFVPNFNSVNTFLRYDAHENRKVGQMYRQLENMMPAAAAVCSTTTQYQTIWMRSPLSSVLSVTTGWGTKQKPCLAPDSHAVRGS